MKNVLAITVILSLQATAQEPQPPDTIRRPPVFWTNSLVGTFTITQVSLTDWIQGGENALAYTTFLNGKAVYEENEIVWSNSFKFAFGQTRLGSQELRKTEDKLELESVLTYKLGTYINPYAATTFKSQFASGFKYDNLGGRIPVSRFYDPAYLTQSLGAGYQLMPEVKTRLGAALREIVTSEFFSYADDPKTSEIERVKIEDGLESVTDVQWRIEENTTFSSKLELFASFRTLEKIIVRGDNTLTTKLGKFVTLLFNVQVINERLASPRTQAKQTLAIGVNFTLI